jgi:hypothetical protein
LHRLLDATMRTSPSDSYAPRRRWVAGVLALISAQPASLAANRELTLPQQVGVLRGELERAGQPWPKVADDGVTAAIKAKDHTALHRALADEVFDVVQINPEGRVKISRGPAAELVAGRPKLFLVKIENASGGRQLLTPLSRYVGAPRNPFTLTFPTVGKLAPELVGQAVEYRLMEVACEGAGKHEITVVVEAGQGSQDLGFRAEVPVLFTVAEPPR